MGNPWDRKSWDVKAGEDFNEWWDHMKLHFSEIESALDDIGEMQLGEEPLLSCDPRVWLMEECEGLKQAAEELLDLKHKARGKTVDVPRMWRTKENS